jgi:hypothetical protein
VIGDLPYSLVECFSQVPRGRALERSVEIGGEDAPAQGMADGADQL